MIRGIRVRRHRAVSAPEWIGTDHADLLAGMALDVGRLIGRGRTGSAGCRSHVAENWGAFAMGMSTSWMTGLT